jgi:hypothetical protein
VKRERERRKDGRPGEGGGSPAMEEGREAHRGQLSAFSFCGQANGVVWEGERS